MADADLLSDTEQLAEDAKVLDAWADCAGSSGRMDIIRRAAAALREVAAIYSIVPAPSRMTVRTCAPELA